LINKKNLSHNTYLLKKVVFISNSFTRASTGTIPGYILNTSICLKEMDEVTFVELDATLVKDEEAFEKEVQRCLAVEEECIRAGKTVCCYTTRALITADTGNKEDELRLSVRISDAVQSLVGRLTVTPAFVIAKGGITSSDVGTKALAVKKANVLGQIRPGIPVWQTGEESTFPKTPYVIFPGNVGEATTLKEAVEILLAKKRSEHY